MQVYVLVCVHVAVFAYVHLRECAPVCLFLNLCRPTSTYIRKRQEEERERERGGGGGGGGRRQIDKPNDRQTETGTGRQTGRQAGR